MKIKPTLIILAVFITFLAFSAPAMADDTIVLSTPSIDIKQGQSAELEIEIANVDILAGMNFKLYFDNSAFSVDKSSVKLTDKMEESSLVFSLNASQEKGMVAAIAASWANQQVGWVEKTAVVKMKITADKSAAPKEYPLTFDDILAFKIVENNVFEPYDIKIEPGVITVLPSDDQPPAEDTDKFTDLDGFEWAADSINALAKAGIIKGAAEAEYRPQQNITRAEFCKLIGETFGFNEVDESAVFTDVSNDDWFYALVMATAKAGIVTGYPEGDFRPVAEISREEAAVILIRSLKAAEVEIPQGEMTFADADEIGDWSVASIASLVQMGMVNGKGDNKFAPKDNLTRAEAAKIIYSAYEVVQK